MLHHAKLYPNSTIEEIEEEIIFCELLKSQGYCNDVFLLKTKQHYYILREFKKQQVNRKNEYLIHS